MNVQREAELRRRVEESPAGYGEDNGRPVGIFQCHAKPGIALSDGRTFPSLRVAAVAMGIPASTLHAVKTEGRTIRGTNLQVA